MKLQACAGLDPSDERGEIIRRALGRDDLGVEVRDPHGSLLQLGDQLGNVIGHRDRLGKSLLFAACRGQLGFEAGDVGLVLRQLRGDLRADLGQHQLEHAVAEDVALQMLDPRGLDLRHRLVDGHGADRAPTLVVARASVAEHAFGGAAECTDAGSTDRAAARATLGDAGERILRCRASRAGAA